MTDRAGILFWYRRARSAEADNAAKDAEIARLNAECEGGMITIAEERARAEAAEAEIARLTKALEGAFVVIETVGRPDGIGPEVAAALDKRVAAVRAALTPASP